jgi:hypothetical protein
LLYRYKLSPSRFKDIFEVFSLTAHTATIILPGKQKLKSVWDVSQEDIRYHIRGGLSGSPPRSLVQGHAIFLEISRMPPREHVRLFNHLVITPEEKKLVVATSEFMHQLIDVLEVPEPVLLLLALTAHQIQFIGAAKILKWFTRGEREEHSEDLRMRYGARTLFKLARRCQGIMLWEHYRWGLKLSDLDLEYLKLLCDDAMSLWNRLQKKDGLGGEFPNSESYPSPLEEED